MPRILLITAGVLLALCIVCVGAGYFVVRPKLGENVETEVQQAVSTYVAPQIAGIGVTPEPKTYELTEDMINSQLQSENANLNDLRFVISPEGLEVRFGEQGQDIAYNADVTAVDGKLKIKGEELNGFIMWLIPQESISKGIENGINDYLSENNLMVSSVTMNDGAMTLVLTEGPDGASLRSA